jgi:hypothetical protein
MRLLRINRDSVMAMLEAFVWDPVISMRLLAGKEEGTTDPVGVDTEASKSPVDLMRDQISRNLQASLGMDEEGGGGLTSPDVDKTLANGAGGGITAAPVVAMASSMLDGTVGKRGGRYDIVDDEPMTENLNARYETQIN